MISLFSAISFKEIFLSLAALESVEEVRRSLLIALIDRKVNKYIAALDGICRKMEKDKYLVIMKKKSVSVLQENRFDLLVQMILPFSSSSA